MGEGRWEKGRKPSGDGKRSSIGAGLKPEFLKAGLEPRVLPQAPEIWVQDAHECYQPAALLDRTIKSDERLIDIADGRLDDALVVRRTMTFAELFGDYGSAVPPAGQRVTDAEITHEAVVPTEGRDERLQAIDGLLDAPHQA